MCDVQRRTGRRTVASARAKRARQTQRAPQTGMRVAPRGARASARATDVRVRVRSERTTAAARAAFGRQNYGYGKSEGQYDADAEKYGTSMPSNPDRSTARRSNPEPDAHTSTEQESPPPPLCCAASPRLSPSLHHPPPPPPRRRRRRSRSSSSLTATLRRKASTSLTDRARTTRS